MSLFSQRILGHPRIAQHWPNPKASNPQVLAANDELLVSESASKNANVLAWLKTNALNGKPLTTVFDRFKGEGEDVEIWGLDPTVHNVFAVTDNLRSMLPDAQAAKVGPNHVLIPAANGDQCPYGAPSPAPAPVVAHPKGPPKVPVTVIDSGYIDWGDTKTNPLLALCSAVTYHPGPFQSAGMWNDSTPDVPDASVPPAGHLDALAGHANFVAGVIAQHCSEPQIAIWNHNGGFSWNSKEIPLESAVCRSIRQSQHATPDGTPSGVIHVGFSFAAYTDKAHDLWRITLKRIGPKHIVVAPAGNQGTDDPRYPAALHALHPNVIGVGSVNPQGKVSTFSNRGRVAQEWLTCSAVGENIVSTFLQVNLPPEEKPALLQHNFNGWAVWNGTSFAAPRVAAAYVNVLPGRTPAQATKRLAIEPIPQLAIGTRMPF